MAETVGSNVLFLRGSQANLPSSGAQPGAFYLTEDTHRLYAGNADGGVDLLSQSIAVVANQSALGTAAAPAVQGQFVYIADGNILAVYEDESGVEGGQSGWRQINAHKDQDTKLDSQTYTLTTADGTVTVANSLVLKDIDGGAAGTKGDSFSIKGAGSVSVASTGKAITVTGKEYDLSKAADSAKIALSDGGENPVAEIEFVGGDNVTIDSSVADKFTISAVDTITSISSVTGAAAAQGFTVTVAAKDQNDGAKGSGTGTIDPVIALSSKDEEGNYKSQVHFVNGIAELDVYSKAEIDAKELALNALHYKGVINSAAELAALEKVENGDLYKIGANFTVGEGESAVTYKINDVIIANGTEGTDGTIANPTWDLIEAGAAEGNAIYYGGVATSGTNSAKLEIKDRVGADGTPTTTVAAMEIKAGDGLTLSGASNSGASQSITLAHAEIDNQAALNAVVGSAADVAQTAGGQEAFTAITKVQVDEFGHVSALEAKSFTPIDTKVSSVTNTASVAVAADNKTATITDTVKVKHSDNSEVSNTANAAVKLNSDTIKLEADGTDTIKMNLVWGSFNPAA